jgi:uncharacterized membrane protein
MMVEADAGSGLERIIMFSDAVIAIAITLLVLDLRLPPLPEHADSAAVAGAIIAVAAKIEAYIVSFLVVGLFWYSHHLRFRFIRRYDTGLIWLNMLFLMAIGFMPFSSSVVSEHPVASAYALYDGSMALCSLLSATVWCYAIVGNRLVSPDLAPKIRRQSLWSPLIVAAVFVLSGIVGQIEVRAGRWMLLLLIPATVMHPVVRRTGRSVGEPT